MAQNNPRTIYQITELIIHCAATPNGRQVTAADVDRWHGERGFNRPMNISPFHCPNLKHIGYHWVIDIKGRVEAGRHWKEIGAHAEKHNLNSLGVMLAGTDRFYEAQFIALQTLVESLRRTFPQLKSTIGHRDVNSHKTCPGFDVTEWFADGMKPPVNHLLPTPGDR